MKLKTIIAISTLLSLGNSFAEDLSEEQINTEIERLGRSKFEPTGGKIAVSNGSSSLDEQIQRTKVQLENDHYLSQQHFRNNSQLYWPPGYNNGFQNPYGINTEQIFTCSPGGKVCTNAQGIKYWREGASKLGDRDGGKRDEGSTPNLNIKDLVKPRGISF